MLYFMNIFGIQGTKKGEHASQSISKAVRRARLRKDKVVEHHGPGLYYKNTSVYESYKTYTGRDRYEKTRERGDETGL